MTKHSHTVGSTSNNMTQHDDPMEEDLPDLAPLIESMAIFSGSSSQIQTQVRVDSLGSLIDLSLAQVSLHLLAAI